MTQTSEAIHQCQACDTLWTEEQITPLEEVKDLLLRIDPGEVVPSGECPDPDCGALTHLTGRDGEDREVGMMPDMRQAYDRWLDAHGQHHPVWDDDQLRGWLNENHPRWMFLMGDELDAVLGEAMEDESADVRSTLEERAYDERQQLHEEQAQKYGEDLRGGE